MASVSLDQFKYQEINRKGDGLRQKRRGCSADHGNTCTLGSAAKYRASLEMIAGDLLH